MKLRTRLFILLILTTIILTGCKANKDIETIIEPEPKEVVEVPETPMPVEEPIREGIPSPLSGIYAEKAVVDQRVVSVMFDNHHNARWQAGLKDAEIVYEFPVEAPYTRYLGLYLLNNPESIGPIRSSRPYFVTKALEFDAIYVRVGGSEQAKADVKNLRIADIDGLTSSNKVFWRNNNKKAPNNLYSSMAVIRQTQIDKGFNQVGEYEGFKFNYDDKDIDGYVANSILINYMSNNTTKYIYHKENKIYNREKDGKVHIDESDSSVITAKNIIIQEANVRVIDNEGRLDITLIGEGNGKYFTNGIGKDIKWVKEKRESKTFYYDESGQELILNPGITWIQIIDLNPSIIIE